MIEIILNVMHRQAPKKITEAFINDVLLEH